MTQVFSQIQQESIFRCDICGDQSHEESHDVNGKTICDYCFDRAQKCDYCHSRFDDFEKLAKDLKYYVANEHDSEIGIRKGRMCTDCMQEEVNEEVVLYSTLPSINVALPAEVEHLDKFIDGLFQLTTRQTA